MDYHSDSDDYCRSGSDCKMFKKQGILDLYLENIQREKLSDE